MSQILPSTNLIPAVLTNAKVYKDGVDQLGVATVEAPDFEYLTESISGLGIAGEMDVPVAGHFKSMALKIKWNTANDKAVVLLQPVGHHIEVRGNIQELDAGSGKFVNKAVKVVAKSLPKKIGIGKFEPGKKMEPETELEIYYYKLWLGGRELVEVDKLNFIFRLDGIDQLADVRANLGM